jgi:hypothetical protein
MDKDHVHTIPTYQYHQTKKSQTLNLTYIVYKNSVHGYISVEDSLYTT